jgi:hypothetical protein
MYVFGIDIAANVAMGIGVILHLIEFALAVIILRRLRAKGNTARQEASGKRGTKKSGPEKYDEEVEEEWSSLE